MLGGYLLSLKGCQIGAGGRSVAKTTGQQSKIVAHPERVSEARWHPSRVRSHIGLFPVVYATLRPGYCLTALQAVMRPTRYRAVVLTSCPLDIEKLVKTREA